MKLKIYGHIFSNSFLFLFLILLLSISSCKKGLKGNCNKDSDCKSGLICEGHMCLKYIDCELLKSKYTNCIHEILTVRDPSYKPSTTDKKFHITKFKSSYYKICKKERGTYDKPGIEKCLKINSCSSFAKCLLNLESISSYKKNLK